MKGRRQVVTRKEAKDLVGQLVDEVYSRISNGEELCLASLWIDMTGRMFHP